MPNINKANRQVCDVDIRSLDRKPVLFFETANTTTQALTGESVYATAKGVKRIAFANPIEGTITIEAQVYPFELYSLISGGVIETDAAYPEKAVVKADADGSLKVPANAMAGSVFVMTRTGEFAGTESLAPCRRYLYQPLWKATLKQARNMRLVMLPQRQAA